MTTKLHTNGLVTVDGPGDTILSAMRRAAAQRLGARVVLLDTEHLAGDTYRATYRTAVSV